MQIYKAPVDEMRFLLEAFNYNQITELEGFDGFDIETAIARTNHPALQLVAGKFEGSKLQHARFGQIQGRFDPRVDAHIASMEP